MKKQRPEYAVWRNLMRIQIEQSAFTIALLKREIEANKKLMRVYQDAIKNGDAQEKKI